MSNSFDYKFNGSLQKELPAIEIIEDDAMKNATTVLFDNKDKKYIRILGTKVETDSVGGKRQEIEWTKTPNKEEATRFSADAARIAQEKTVGYSNTISHLLA
jgi:hypothetical protein